MMPHAEYLFIKRLLIEFTDDTYFEADRYAVKNIQVTYLTSPIPNYVSDNEIIDIEDYLTREPTKIRVTITFEGETSTWGMDAQSIQQSLLNGNFRLTEGEQHGHD